MALPLFEYSRNPLEALLREPKNAAPSTWFDDNGARALRGFLRALDSHPDVKCADFDIAQNKSTDDFGLTHSCEVLLKIERHHGTRIFVRGAGTAASRAEAKVIALGETFERLGCSIQHRMSSGPIRPVLRSPSTNGASFHSSPARAIRGGVCERSSSATRSSRIGMRRSHCRTV